MERQDVSPDKQLLRKVQDRLSTARAQFRETPGAKQASLQKDWPPQPFLYQG